MPRAQPAAATPRRGPRSGSSRPARARIPSGRPASEPAHCNHDTRLSMMRSVAPDLVEREIFEDPLTWRADRGLISAPWRACPVVGQPMTNLNSPMTPGGRPRPAAPAPPNGCPATALQCSRVELLVRRFFDRICSISALFPLFFYGGPRPRRSMRHHRHVHRCHQHTAARRCRAHRSGGPDRPGRAPRRRRSGTGQKRGTSRIALPPTREARGHEDAGQAGSVAVSKDPDCRGRLAVKLLRLLGGRR